MQLESGSASSRSFSNGERSGSAMAYNISTLFQEAEDLQEVVKDLQLSHRNQIWALQLFLCDLNHVDLGNLRRMDIDQKFAYLERLFLQHRHLSEE
jgi:hypothetical protein